MKRSHIIVLISITILLLIIIFNSINNQSFQRQLNSQLVSQQLEILAQNLDTVWAIDFLPKGELIFTERTGKVSIIKNDQVQTIANIKVSEISESGLAGIAVDPKFNENNNIYLYYTHTKANRVSKFKLINNQLENESILLDNIPSARFHDGGRIKFGPDNKIYITTGDATNLSSSQDIDSLAGKILRINDDGSIPKDNPYNNLVYSYGHRNPQGITWNLETNQLYATEHGPTRNDELNVIQRGQNYGWPIKCSDQSPNTTIPIKCYTDFTLAPSNIAHHNNNIYIAGLKGKQIRKITLNDKNQITNEEIFLNNIGRIREVIVKDNYLYIGTSNLDGRGIPKTNDDKIIRVKLI
jgi:aldose sugar dehydrogenase